ncbi:MAG: single-stranded-DNA-specific exonuclease RecJ [Gammaproteobacteria bacterium]|nr:single-stranded-DNA-specific exonuclease RecJ [Gammaproteobacteria bacterium]
MNDVSIISNCSEISPELDKSNLNPLLKRVYANRGIENCDQLDYSIAGLLDFKQLKGIDQAAVLIADAVVKDQSIVIVGDFDADGATSSALMVRALRSMGANRVNYLVPNRFEYGYGLTPEIVQLAQSMSPDLIVTVDNGISSIDGVARAKQENIKVVVTDHHLPGVELPAADAIVNPNQPDCEFPSKMMAGVGVAFYVMLAVRAELRSRGWFDGRREEPNMALLLDLVALGTVADVVPLDKNNRLLLEQGLQRIRKSQCCPGIQALLEISAKNIKNCTAQDFGFAVGPRLNAAGRLDDMSIGIECLLSDDFDQAMHYAKMLNDMNQQRREIESDMLAQAMTIMDSLSAKMDQQELQAGLCLYDEQWHQGVVGLLASRVKEKFHRPVIAFADAGDGEIKGSARSISGVHIRDVLDSIASKHPVLIQKFGGHAMAAGLSLKKADLEQFSSAFSEQIEISLGKRSLDKVIETDGGLQPGELSLSMAETLRFAGPWGQCFSEPLFDDEFDVLDWRIVADKHLKLRLRHNVSDEQLEAIAFNQSAEVLQAGQLSLRMIYRMDVNEFRGRRSLQLIIQHIESR